MSNHFLCLPSTSRVACLSLLASFALAACSSSEGSAGRGDAGSGAKSGTGGRAESGGAGAKANAGGTSGKDGSGNGGASGSGNGSGGASGSGNAGASGSGNAGASGSGGSGGKGGSGGATGGGTGVLAARVHDFLGSIGACTHIGQGIDGADQSATVLAYAGITEIRDDGDPTHVADWITVHQKSGARLSLLTNRDVASTISMAKTLNAAGALLAVEGPNEPNNFAVTYENATSSSTTFVPVAHLQRDLYAAVKAEQSLAGIPVFHSSEAGGSEPDNVGLQFLTIPKGAGTTMPEGTVYADYANTHNYVSGHSSKLDDNTTWNASDPTLNGDWDGLYVEYGHTWRGGFTGYSNADLATLPRVTTETGWPTMGNGSITQEQQGRLFLNLYLSAYKRGWSYTFVYMLRDDPNQGYWGFFDTNYTAKTSGVYLHNLTTILADSGSANPGRLDYSIANEPATMHDLLLQKSSGVFELAVWNDRPSGGTDAATVKFGGSQATVKLFDPTIGITPTATHSNVDSVALTLTDHPIIVEVSQP